MTELKKHDALHKKRFGQYFSGPKVAEMLFSLLPKGRSWGSVVDPMAGIGDMLIPVIKNTTNDSQILGVEIDELVARECANRVPEATIICKDAFKSTELITPTGWDLVITNPPYVRYQLQAEDGIMPSARGIRESLIKQIQRITYLSTSEKALFLNLSINYSGLADMAVPAWILCASLVKSDGYLAVVVPETWLNRDYAGPIQYLLQKCFVIETIAKDTNASWFPEALVKTCLVVARRTEMKQLTDNTDSITRIIEIDREYTQPSLSLFPFLKGSKEALKWANREDCAFFSASSELPHELDEILDHHPDDCISLSELGIECGQGLRSGANEFFYVEVKREDKETLVVHSKAWDKGGRDYRFNKKDILFAIQNRGEIDGLVITIDKLRNGVVYPQEEVTGDLQKYIDSAESYRDSKGRRFKDYSAVKPNEKKKGDIITCEWFRLPKMASRHIPNLCLTRVSSKIPECLYVEQGGVSPIVVDANMVTLWSTDMRTIRIAMALLNSTWSKLSLELICTVMGGGALKIEASHIKKLLFPRFSMTQLDAFEKVGSRLITMGTMTGDIQDEIDRIMASYVGGDRITEQMRTLLSQKYKERSTRL